MYYLKCSRSFAVAGQTSQEHFTEIYKAIGSHFIENAETMASEMTHDSISVTFYINLTSFEMITIDKTTSTIVKGAMINE